MFLGFVRTPMGTGCLLLLLVGIGMLLFRRQLDVWKTLGYLVGLSLTLFSGVLSVPELLSANMVLFSMLFLIGDPAVAPCQPVPAYFGAMITGLLTGFFIIGYHIEYAPVIAIILTCPLWRGLDMLYQRFFSSTEPEESDAQEEEDGE